MDTPAPLGAGIIGCSVPEGCGGGGEVCAAPNHIYLLKIVSGEETSGV